MNDMKMEEQQMGGRRHMGTKKRHGNASLRAWVTFVKKVQREEHVSYKEAMSLAKKRKDKGEKWRGGGDDDEKSAADNIFPTPVEDAIAEDDVAIAAAEDENDLGEEGFFMNDPNDANRGGRRRRRRGTKKRRGSKKRRGTKKRRGSRRRRH